MILPYPGHLREASSHPPAYRSSTIVPHQAGMDSGSSITQLEEAAVNHCSNVKADCGVNWA